MAAKIFVKIMIKNGLTYIVNINYYQGHWRNVFMESIAANKICFRKAVLEDGNAASSLTLMAYKDFAYDMLGLKSEEEVLRYFKKLWNIKNNRFSYEYSYIVEIDSKLVGLITCYPGRNVKKLIIPTIKEIFKLGKEQFLWHICTHINYYYHFAFTVEAYNDEYYIGTLAVLPGYRNYGIGTELIKFAKTQAKLEKLLKCSLLVAGDNEAGIRFYERNGFEKVFYGKKPVPYYRVVNIIKE
jgi:ribosomal protein S18 acetylase RimI-like enzyme